MTLCLQLLMWILLVQTPLLVRNKGFPQPFLVSIIPPRAACRSLAHSRLLTIFSRIFSYTSALQTIALFGLKMNRFPAMIGALVFLILYVTSLTFNLKGECTKKSYLGRQSLLSHLESVGSEVSSDSRCHFLFSLVYTQLSTSQMTSILSFFKPSCSMFTICGRL